MAAATFGNIVNSYGLKSNGMNAIDVVSGIPVRISNYKGNATVYVYCGKDNVSDILPHLQTAADSAGIRKPTAAGEAISFNFKSARLAVDHYGKIRDILIANAGLFNLDKCPYCFMGNCDVAGMYQSNSARRMHRQCYLNMRNSSMEMVSSGQGNYLTGILVALLFAIGMIALGSLCVIGGRMIFYILYLGFPLAIASGFRIGKGPYGAKGTFCHMTISVLAIFGYFYVMGVYWAYETNPKLNIIEHAMNFNKIWNIITSPVFMKNKDMILQTVLLVVGLLIALAANPTSRKSGQKNISQNDVFITPLVTPNTGFSGNDTYHAFEYQQSQGYTDQTASDSQTTWVDPYANAGSGDNEGKSE
ncbi:MAG: hypothetical protein K5871_01635 [Lachnospiraceae bacterium]|nr:hypothetical protein [Lachnospiraceae bacterium]